MGGSEGADTPAGRLVQAVWQALGQSGMGAESLRYDLGLDALRMILPLPDGTESVLRLPYRFIESLDQEDGGARRFAHGWVTSLNEKQSGAPARVGGGELGMVRWSRTAALMQIWLEGQLGIPSSRVILEPVVIGGLILRVTRGAVPPFTFRVGDTILARHEPEELVAILERARAEFGKWILDPGTTGAQFHHLAGVGLVVRPEK